MTSHYHFVNKKEKETHLFLFFTMLTFGSILCRHLSTAVQRSIPPPRGKITDHHVFLSRIGRGCGELSSKFRVSPFPECIYLDSS
jgi:hypothetical protein